MGWGLGNPPHLEINELIDLFKFLEINEFILINSIHFSPPLEINELIEFHELNSICATLQDLK